MKDTIRGIAIGVIAALIIGASVGISGGSIYFVLSKISEHDAIWRQHANAIAQVLQWQRAQPVKKR